MAFKKIKGALFGSDDLDSENLEDEFYLMSEKSYKEDAEDGSKMILVEPRAYSESQTIADHLKKRNEAKLLKQLIMV